MVGRLFGSVLNTFKRRLCRRDVNEPFESFRFICLLACLYGMQDTQVNDNDPWDAEPEEIIPTTISLPEPINKVGEWQSKIEFSFDGCRKWGMSEKHIDWIKYGVDLSLHTRPGAASVVDNYSSMTGYEDINKIEADLEAWLDRGYLELIDKPGLGFVPLGLVPKPPPPPDPITGKIDTSASGKRIISDLSASGLNACIRDIKMRLPSPRDFVRRMKKGVWMAKIDLKDGFFHIPIKPQFVDYLCIQFPVSGKYARFRVLPFGIKCAPAIFQHLMLEILRMFKEAWKREHGDDASAYIDDLGVFSMSKERAQEGFELLIRMLTEMGFIVHPTKR